MPAENKFLGLSTEQLQDIGLGIGRGFQTFDPNNPFAGAGAAMEATIASGMSRKQRTEDIAMAKEAYDRKYRFEEQRELNRERREDKRDQEQAAEFDRRLKATEESKLRLIEKEIDVKESEQRAERERQIGLGVFTLEKGFNPSLMSKVDRDFMEQFPDVPRFPGSAPRNPDQMDREMTLRERLEASGMKVRPSNRPPELLRRDTEPPFSLER